MPPYPRLSQTFLNAADCCDMAIFVGSSLRDHHIRGAVQTTASRVPVFIVNPEGNNYGLEQVHPIKQFASTFLIAILPNALITTDPAETLKKVAALPSDDRGTLIAARLALDADAQSNLRCRALEELDDMGVTLDSFLLGKLLADNNPTVARYSLGLISLSVEQDTLIEEAEISPHANDPAFREDLQLLRDMATKLSN